ncbi:hypothetical protein [Acidocella aromatica]|uniref:Aminoglycoside phosphotransferase domain-containing protein n=1 Tax=Acidocella aromatica TaxID=1303579 RepID=A0A840VBM4_9PROT|nr:hypothetical protein [Acidocella aromatica]MBB5372237.1 hypothetical protein [Acidocella aromatica]
MPVSESRTAALRQLAAAGRIDEAVAGVVALLADLFGLDAQGLRINSDQYSLNSLNGFFSAGGDEFFFKFHQEDGEETMAGEYYRAGLLAAAGLPVDMPAHVSRLPGEQILVYRRRHEPRFADTLRALDALGETSPRALAAEAGLDEALLAVAQRTLHVITPEQAAAEPLHQLFHNRLVDDGHFPGGRYKRFYLRQSVDLPGLTLPWEDFAALPFVINGARYRHTLDKLFVRAAERLNPLRLADAGGVTAHGDAHNANVWDTLDGLVFFDPAFAGENVPSLLAEVKSTFHNMLAHPFWLYDPEETASRYKASVRVENGALHIETDWAPTALRRALLEVKAERFWRPFLNTLHTRDMLPEDWREVLRLALFLCPTLVMDLCAGMGRHNPVSSAIGFAVAMMAGSAPVDAPAAIDLTAPFLAALQPGLGDQLAGR